MLETINKAGFLLPSNIVILSQEIKLAIGKKKKVNEKPNKLRESAKCKHLNDSFDFKQSQSPLLRKKAYSISKRELVAQNSKKNLAAQTQTFLDDFSELNIESLFLKIYPNQKITARSFNQIYRTDLILFYFGTSKQLENYLDNLKHNNGFENGLSQSLANLPQLKEEILKVLLKKFLTFLNLFKQTWNDVYKNKTDLYEKLMQQICFIKYSIPPSDFVKQQNSQQVNKIIHHYFNYFEEVNPPEKPQEPNNLLWMEEIDIQKQKNSEQNIENIKDFILDVVKECQCQPQKIYKNNQAKKMKKVVKTENNDLDFNAKNDEELIKLQRLKIKLEQQQKKKEYENPEAAVKPLLKRSIFHQKIDSLSSSNKNQAYSENLRFISDSQFLISKLKNIEKSVASGKMNKIITNLKLDKQSKEINFLLQNQPRSAHYLSSTLASKSKKAQEQKEKAENTEQKFQISTFYQPSYFTPRLDKPKKSSQQLKAKPWKKNQLEKISLIRTKYINKNNQEGKPNCSATLIRKLPNGRNWVQEKKKTISKSINSFYEKQVPYLEFNNYQLPFLNLSEKSKGMLVEKKNQL